MKKRKKWIPFINRAFGISPIKISCICIGMIGIGSFYGSLSVGVCGDCISGIKPLFFSQTMTEEAAEKTEAAEQTEAPEQMEISEKDKKRSREELALDESLHARAAVLLDMDSGRVLYEKNGDLILPMASTTKIMTCILALEESDPKEIVTASAYAAAQPKVHLGMQKGNTYQMQDLLYSLMLESHNDSAVAVAEHIGGKKLDLKAVKERTKEESREAVKVFCDRMTEKAREIGCSNTHFLTPNGLDAKVKTKDGTEIIHATTAEDLARIMDYCVNGSPKKEEFLKITQTRAYTFSDTGKKRQFSCINHNALLTMMDGAVSGKTGFTNQAGYCYVGAAACSGKNFALALLACGWPSHKGWKWEDCRKLFSYGEKEYEYRQFSPEVHLEEIVIENGAPKSGNPWEEVRMMPEKEKGESSFRILTKENECVRVKVRMERRMRAPVKKGRNAGEITYYIEGENGEAFILGKEKLYLGEEIREKNFCFFLNYIGKKFLL